ncbi:efflux RND transporter periplasmic adaptor subunit [Methylococcus sp. EFPC2]|uniref:efflux RND transporter periplasmic adaptor subunit n=1 Tax=Methylococcus sp. EFPC2 TaxID=2812648 RepID=UPI0019678CC4|nr:efflux RND transporter periplasmic adaptor subunit [Methylococcus sp. EFPC2]QSA95852.1 efflux RND transporter periplasmic adaptor subunit [Methylococcus sp. EFPC2]
MTVFRITRLAAVLVGISLLNLPDAVAETPRTVDATPALSGLIKIQAIGQAEVRDSLRLPARVELDQKRVARIGATVSGRLTDIRAFLGQPVRKGDVLAMLNSTELGMAQSDYLKACSQVNLRRLAVQRARRLLESDVIAAAELQEREGVLNEAEVDMHAAEDRLRVLGMSEGDLKRLARERTLRSYSPVTASIDGVVIERNVNLGQVTQPSDALYTVADLSHVWLVAEVPEQQAQWAHTGDEAEAEIPALPGQNVRGKLIYVADIVDPETRTVTVRMDIPNPVRSLKPQMLATLLIQKQGAQTLVVPDGAVVREEDKDYVFVEIAPQKFALRAVRLGEAEGSQRPVLDGLKAGERVVVAGAFHLNNERLRKELE